MGASKKNSRTPNSSLQRRNIHPFFSIANPHRYPLIIAVTALISLLAGASLHGQPWIPGNRYYGLDNYLEYVAGDLPIIITAPHGGNLYPDFLPDRTCGVTANDFRTQELINDILHEIHQLTGRYPHIIINKIHRSKIDLNRDLNEATCGEPLAEPYWHEWQRYIDTAKAIVTRNWGKGFYIDLHGHAHDVQQIEWGYMLTSSQLELSDESLNLDYYIERSSIRNLAGNNASGLSHSALLRGEFSIGSMMAAMNFPGVPSTNKPFPGGEPYFSGGFNTKRNGSVDGGTIDGVQLEANRDIRTDHLERLRLSGTLAAAILDFVKMHYFPQIEEFYTWDSSDNGISFDAFDVAYTQNFDDIFPGDQTHFLQDNDQQFPGFYAFNTLDQTSPLEFRRYTLNLSTTGGGRLYNAASSNNLSDRAVGLIYSSTTGPLGFGLRFRNNAGDTIRALDITYTGEQWRVGGDATGVVENILHFDYMQASRVTNIQSVNYTPFAPLNFISPNTNPALYQTAINGNLEENKRTISASINVTIPPGEEIMLRWIDKTNDPAFDHLLAVDDLIVIPRSTTTSINETPHSPPHQRVITYPNPVSHILKTDIPETTAGKLQIITLTGKTVLSQYTQPGTTTIDVSNLFPGIYIIKTENNSIIRTGRFVKY